MVRVRLENNFPNIIGLENGERPLQLLQDDDKILYLIMSLDYSILDNRILIGKENEELVPVDRVIKIHSYRDGGTTEAEFIKDSEKGEIYVPSSFKDLPSKLRFKGEEKELRKVGYTTPYFFNEYPPQSKAL